MCKNKCEQCKCKNSEQSTIDVKVETIYDEDTPVDYTKYEELVPSTTCPHNILNKNKEKSL